MKIYVQIDGLLRDDLDKISKVYSKYYLDNQEINISDYNLSKYLKFETKNINLIEFNHNVDFENQVFDVLDDSDTIESFLDENSLEIFGHANEKENNIIQYLNDLEKITNYEIILFSIAEGKKIPSTLFFLTKYSSTIKTIKFFNNIIDLYKSIKKNDILIFDFLDDKNFNKKIKTEKIIKLNKDYNKNLKSMIQIESLKEVNKKMIENV